MEKKIDKETLAYFAGIIDGEGCISLRPATHTGNTYVLQVQVTNTYKELCQKMKDLFGGSFLLDTRKGNRKQSYKWQISCQKAVSFLQPLLPYLMIKKVQAEVVLSLMEHKQRYGSQTPKYYQIEKRAKEAITKLNRRGAI